MLKKAGIIVAAAAAGLLAVSPLAFAGEGHGKDGKDSSHSETANAGNSKGFVNVSGNAVNVPIQACNNNVPINAGILPIQVPDNELAGAISGALGLLAPAKSGDATSTITRSCGDNSGSVGTTAVVK